MVDSDLEEDEEEEEEEEGELGLQTPVKDDLDPGTSWGKTHPALSQRQFSLLLSFYI